METIGAFDAKTHLSALLERVAKGERFTITRHGTPVAQLVPVTRRDPEQIKAVVQRMQDIAADVTLDGDWKNFRDAGRKW
ncbi:type II toxin-antitoxin system Phd/YefM family antitoxin [Rhodopila sp.]|uniref:type II toxin-antitoxin system Phd/YefM family antitoxin n=1 Tax=Rhodopila sp. TaxID=2480087 RepID=UPI003D13ADB3